MAWLLDPFRQFAQPNGRSCRHAFWPFAGLVAVLLIATAIGFPPLAGLLALVVGIPLATLATRRLHDVGLSGFWLLPLPVVPALMFVLLVVGNSIFTLLVVAIFDATISESAISNVILGTEEVLGWSFAGWLLLSIIALLWPGTKGRNQFGDDPRAIGED